MALPSVKQAFLLHVAISLVIFIILVVIMRLIWYPGDLFYIDGGIQGLKIIAPIDLVLGPALTLLLYRPWKKSLKFDMATIAIVQVAALSYGVFVAYQQRTAAIVFAENRFETISLSEFTAATAEMRENDLEPVSLKEFSRVMPAVVHAKSFQSADYGQYLADLMNGLPELRERSDRYQPIAKAKGEIAEYRVDSQSDGTGIAGSTGKGEAVEIPASSIPERADAAETADSAEIYTLKARYGNGTIEFDPASFQWIKIKRQAE